MSNNKTKQQSIISNEDQQIAKVLGRKLGFLIGASTMDDETKQGWFAILPEMRLEQIARLIDILEAKYLDEQTQDINKTLEQELDIIQKKYQQEREEIDQDTIDRIKKLGEKLAVSSA